LRRHLPKRPGLLGIGPVRLRPAPGTVRLCDELGLHQERRHFRALDTSGPGHPRVRAQLDERDQVHDLQDQDVVERLAQAPLPG
jgi:hypothetical protein